MYNNLSRGHPKWWFSKGIPPKMALNSGSGGADINTEEDIITGALRMHNDTHVTTAFAMTAAP